MPSVSAWIWWLNAIGCWGPVRLPIVTGNDSLRETVPPPSAGITRASARIRFMIAAEPTHGFRNCQPRFASFLARISRGGGTIVFGGAPRAPKTRPDGLFSPAGLHDLEQLASAHLAAGLDVVEDRGSCGVHRLGAEASDHRLEAAGGFGFDHAHAIGRRGQPGLVGERTEAAHGRDDALIVGIAGRVAAPDDLDHALRREADEGRRERDDLAALGARRKPAHPGRQAVERL